MFAIKSKADSNHHQYLPSRHFSLVDSTSGQLETMKSAQSVGLPFPEPGTASMTRQRDEARGETGSRMNQHNKITDGPAGDSTWLVRL